MYLRIFGNFEYNEIAEIMNKTSNWARVIFFRGKQKLKEELEDENECDIVCDLLFSYNDGILSNTSKELVEEHLKKCEKCKKNLEEIKQENNQKNQVKRN